MLSLPKHYRILAYNDSGVNISIGDLTVNALRYKFVNGVLTYEATQAEIFNNTGALNHQAYGTGATQDNSSLVYVRGWGMVSCTLGGSPSGSVTLFLQASLDNGTTWGTDADASHQIAQLAFTTATTKRVEFIFP